MTTFDERRAELVAKSDDIAAGIRNRQTEIQRMLAEKSVVDAKIETMDETLALIAANGELTSIVVSSDQQPAAPSDDQSGDITESEMPQQRYPAKRKVQEYLIANGPSHGDAIIAGLGGPKKSIQDFFERAVPKGWLIHEEGVYWLPSQIAGELSKPPMTTEEVLDFVVCAGKYGVSQDKLLAMNGLDAASKLVARGDLDVDEDGIFRVPPEDEPEVEEEDAAE